MRRLSTDYADMARVRDNSLLGDGDEQKKLALARAAKLPIHKLLAAVDNEELRGRLESQWQNTAVLSAFIASISISCIFVEIDLDESDPEHSAKKAVRSIFYVASTISSICETIALESTRVRVLTARICLVSAGLLLATVVLIENLTTLKLIRMRYVDDMLYKMGALEGIPSFLTVVALVLLIALFPLYMFINFGHGWEFYVILICTCVMTVGGLGYFVWCIRCLKAARTRGKAPR